MPQFDPHVAVPQIVWLIAVFAILYLIVRAALPKVERVVGSRAHVIGADLGAAELAKTNAAGIIAGYEASLTAARAAAAKVAAEAKEVTAAATAAQLKVVETDLAAHTSAATARIEAAQAEALVSLKGVAADATTEIVERLTGRRPAADEVAAAVGA